MILQEKVTIHPQGTLKPGALKALVKELKIRRTSISSEKTAPFNTWGETPDGKIFFSMPSCQIRLRENETWSRWLTLYRTLIQHPSNEGSIIISISTRGRKRRVHKGSRKLTEIDIKLFEILLKEGSICMKWDLNEFTHRMRDKKTVEIKI